MRKLAEWSLLGAATLALGAGLGAVGLPSSYLFGALLAGLGAALLAPGRLEVPDPAFTVAQGVTGVTLGAYLESDSLEAVAGSWLPVLVVSAGTLALSVAAGRLLARATDCDETTASLGLVAGGRHGHRGHGRRAGRRRPAGGVHAVRARADRGADHAAGGRAGLPRPRHRSRVGPGDAAAGRAVVVG